MILTLCYSAIALIYLFTAIKRLFSDRINKNYKYASFIRTVFVIFLFAATLLAFSTFSSWFSWTHVEILSFSLVLQCLGAFVIIYSMIVHNKRGHIGVSIAPAKNLPSVSVCIPARNESQDLTECLNLLISSKYPKLEILVYDDSPQPKATAQNKKMYANSGVKFVNGEVPASKWLAKNFAYERLYDESNGEIIIFCGVDTRFSPKTIEEIVSLMQSGASMISILPQNELVGSHGWLKYLAQPTRYAWEIGLPRWIVNRPAVLSTCWAINRNVIESFGSFEAVSRKVVPESYFARQCVAHNLSYRFVYSDGEIDLKNIKSVEEQVSTGIRTRYPQLHRRIENVMISTLLILFVFVGPYLTLILSFLHGYYWLSLAAILCILIGQFAYGKIVELTYRRRMPLAYLLGPVAAVYDVWLVNYSMWQYEFGTVTWKGRDISTPVINRNTGKHHLL